MITQQDAYVLAEQDLARVCARISNMLNTDGVVLVGGAVRDTLLGKMTGHDMQIKDWDIMLPRPLKDIEKNPNISSFKPNSLGGVKLQMADGDEIDVFQHYYASGGAHPYTVLANHFDFNCNCILFRQDASKIEDSVFWLEFLETLNIRRIVGYNDVPLHAQIVRAIKFQNLFSEQFNLSVKIDKDLLHDARKMRIKYSDVLGYAMDKIKNQTLRNQVLQQYKELSR